jgi:hypothetical protein
MKSRGMSHSKMVKELIISDYGIELKPISEKQANERENTKAAKE